MIAFDEQVSVADRDVPDVRVEMRFKNARLYNAIYEHTRNIHHQERYAKVQEVNGCIAAFCEQNGLKSGNQAQIYALLNLKRAPYMKRGGGFGHRLVPRPICERLAVLLERDLSYLFPPTLYAVKWPTLVRETYSRTMVPLLNKHAQTLAIEDTTAEDRIARTELRRDLFAVFRTLTPREEQVVKKRFGFYPQGEMTLSEVARSLDVSTERVRQIEAKALRKLRHPSRARRLKNHLYIDDGKTYEPCPPVHEEPPNELPLPTKERSRNQVTLDVQHQQQEHEWPNSLITGTWRYSLDLLRHEAMGKATALLDAAFARGDVLNANEAMAFDEAMATIDKLDAMMLRVWRNL